MTLSFGIMNDTTAMEYTDEQLIDEWNKVFRSNTSLSEDGVTPSDEIKISVMKGIYEARNSTDGTSAYESDYEREQNEVLEAARALHSLIESTNDPKTKAHLEQTLKDLKPRMAQVGIFDPSDVDNDELNAIYDNYQEAKCDYFRSAQMSEKSI